MNEIIAPEICTIVKLHGRNGAFKLVNDPIFTVMRTNSNTELKIKSNFKGIVQFMCKEGDKLMKDDVLCTMSPCQHDVVVCGMCGLCSALIEITNMGNGNIQCNTGSRMAMVHTNKNLVVSEKTAMSVALNDSLNLLKKRKLSLLIDLDLTILHTTSAPVPENLQDVFHYTIKDEHYRHGTVDYHTKFRPYLKQFLERMHLKFELHIFTFGNRSYAEKIREFIDPQKKLFGQRIITRDESFDAHKKTANLKSLFPRGDDMVCIIDDRPDVWNYAPNFIHVKPYTYFPETGDINNPTEAKKDLTKRGAMNYPTQISDKAENENKTEPETSYPENDDYLLTLENILTEIHTRFYKLYDAQAEFNSPTNIIEKKQLPDTKEIMKELRLHVLKGCRISFSGLIPLGQKVTDTNAYHMLTNLGATYYQNVSIPSLKSQDVLKINTMTKYTTHLISHCDGTDKMKQVTQYIKEINKLITKFPEKVTSPVPRVDLVNINWLWHCYFLWTQIDESLFLFLPSVQQLATPEGATELCRHDSEENLSQHSANSITKKRPHSDNETEDEIKRKRTDSEEAFMNDLGEISDVSMSDDSDSESDGSESSFNEDEWFDKEAILDKKIFGENKEDKDSSSSSSNGDVESSIKNPPKNWEDNNDDENDEADSSEEKECDYGESENENNDIDDLFGDDY